VRANDKPDRIGYFYGNILFRGCMKNPARVIRCDSGLPDGTVRFLSDRIELAEGQRRSVETLTRVVKFKDPFYGKVVIDRKMLASMVKNFNADTPNIMKITRTQRQARNTAPPCWALASQHGHGSSISTPSA
jgi:hypothetical protein